MKILISSYTGLGNFILKTPLIASIQKKYDDCQIDLLFGNAWGAENVLKNSNLINMQYWLTPSASLIEKRKIFKILQKNKYDLVILPFDSSPTFVLFLSKFYLKDALIVSHIAPYNLSLMSRIKTAIYLILFKINWVSVINGRHEIDLNLDLLQAINKKKITYKYDTFVSWKKEDLSCFALPAMYVVIQLSAANGAPTPKIWHPKNFSILIERLLLKYPKVSVVLVGDSGDLDSLNEGVTLNSDRVINLMGQTTLNQLCNILDQAHVVIAHDSGIMHVANALKVPLVALYGPTDFTRTAPLSPTTQVLHSHNECWRKSYGFQNGEADLAKEYPNFYCMSGILIEQVMNVLNEILKGK